MINILKEMGQVCNNKRLAEILEQFHRDRFSTLIKLGRIKDANIHLKQSLFWKSRINEMKNHIQWLHKSIQEN